MAGLTVATSPNQFANTFSSSVVPGVAQTSNVGNQLQGTGAGLAGASISVPGQGVPGQGVPASQGGASLSFRSPLYANIPAAPGRGTAGGYYKGIYYSDPNALASAQAANSFSPIDYNGTTYTDPTSYANAIIGDARTAHDKNITQINQAHDAGLITFDQRQQLIDQNRQSLKDQLANTLNSQQGYFDQVSPDAIQSQQGVMAGKAQDATNQGNQTLDVSAQQLQGDKTAYGTQYANTLSANDAALQKTTDAANNVVLNNQAVDQGIIDAGKNAGLAFANSQPQSTQTAYDPSQLVQNIAGYFINSNAAGLSGDQQMQGIQSQLAGQGFNMNQVMPYIQYAYGQVTNPATTYGKAYSNKTPYTPPQ